MITITKEFTKEQLQQIIETDHVQCGEASDLARIALASLEAEQVSINDDMAYAFHHALSDSSLGAEEVEEIKAGLRAAFANVTAPPAPVSDSLLSELLAIAKKAADAADECAHAEWSDDSMEHSTAIADWERRAAMLQGAEPVTTANKLPECWVACSERMPDDEEDVLCFGQYGDNDIDEERYQFMGWLSSKGIKRVWRVSDGDSQNRRARVTHWMPLPAAPQREGENV
ncbi:DUF551 domain-containing protein [Enterobacter hormaechei]|uniref:DUF551 domain-containing protein n=1 Tax=Enterobacter hormaechei TaxID=158836 RepID=UPI00256EEA17|nr:DUF551 domain-containing protein [Enterobacter hormaechei]MDL5345983.1 DUF551 domain-containing protein [Enterobacter hormaechei]